MSRTQKQIRRDQIRVAMTSGAPKLSAPAVTTTQVKGRLPLRYG